MFNTFRIILVFISALLVSCGGDNDPAPNARSHSGSISPGYWQLSLALGDAQLPLRMIVKSDSSVSLVNGEEVIKITDVIISEDSLHLVMPLYNSAFRAELIDQDSIAGNWYNYDKTEYSIPFTGARVSDSRPALPSTDTTKYRVRFSPDTDGEYPAIGLFRSENGRVTGTFLTETGDYRYLEGTATEDSLVVSCFDGAHMFLFTADINGDSLTNGTFFSGKHYSEPWLAVQDPSVELRDPNAITYLVDEDSDITFTVRKLSGDTVSFAREDYLGKVTIVQLFGSWCPNCYDENVFYKELFEEFKEEGLQVIPVAFEAFDDFEKNKAAVTSQFEKMEMPYQPYLGGKRNKKKTSEMFPMLNQVISYPTSIFIDKEGNVRKVHTGFYGPGTGAYYDRYVKSTRAFVQKLLAE